MTGKINNRKRTAVGKYENGKLLKSWIMKRRIRRKLVVRRAFWRADTCVGLERYFQRHSRRSANIRLLVTPSVFDHYANHSKHDAYFELTGRETRKGQRMKPEREDLYITARYIIYDRIVDIRSIGKLSLEFFSVERLLL